MTYDKKNKEEAVSQQDKTISREPSFMYDTSVEAFDTKGTDIDAITQVLIEEDDVTRFIQENTPAEESLVEKFEYQDIPGDSSSHSPLEKTEGGSLTTEDRGDTEDVARSSAIAMPTSLVQNRRLSNISIEESSKISTTPEGEKYFMKREESFVSKVSKGELSSLAVEISDFCSLQSSASDHSLSVKPMKFSPEKEIVVDDLGSQSSLTVKPLERSNTSLQCSSYEHIYDSVELEEAEDQDKQISGEELLASLEGKFEGTKEIPEYFSSFEELYSKSAEEHVPSTIDESLVRWSAPVGSVEAPILDDEEFSTRFGPIREQIEHHWSEMEVLMSTETLIGKGQQEESGLPCD